VVSLTELLGSSQRNLDRQIQRILHTYCQYQQQGSLSTVNANKECLAVARSADSAKDQNTDDTQQSNCHLAGTVPRPQLAVRIGLLHHKLMKTQGSQIVSSST
jgi:hypothetical protein